MLNAFWHIKLKIIDKGFVIHVDMDGTNILKNTCKRIQYVKFIVYYNHSELFIF